MVRIPGFHCRGLSSIPGPGTELPQAAQHGQKKKKNSREDAEKTPGREQARRKQEGPRLPGGTASCQCVPLFREETSVRSDVGKGPRATRRGRITFHELTAGIRPEQRHRDGVEGQQAWHPMSQSRTARDKSGHCLPSPQVQEQPSEGVFSCLLSSNCSGEVGPLTQVVSF